MATETRAAAQLITHDNYTATTTPTTQTLPKRCNFLLINNTGATNNLLVSFDSGNNFKTIGPNVSLRIDVSGLLSYQQKSNAATTTVEALYGSEL